MDREAFSRRLAERLDISFAAAREVATAAFIVMREAIASGEELRIKEFGSFKARPHGGGKANAFNGFGREWLEVPPHMKVCFKACPQLKQSVLKLPLPEGFKVRKR